MKLKSSGNREGRYYFIFEKDTSFFSLFPKFLLGCKFSDLGVYEEYQEDIPDLNQLENKVEHFKNDEYDIDIVFTESRIVLIVRTNEENKEHLRLGIEAISS